MLARNIGFISLWKLEPNPG